MKPTPSIAAALLLGTMLATTAPAHAQEATPWPELMAQACDTNKDGMITRKEYLDHMARLWDERHAAMMKSDATMKPGMMTHAQFKNYSLSAILGRTTGN